MSNAQSKHSNGRNYGGFQPDKWDSIDFPGEADSDVQYDRKGRGFVVVNGHRIIVEDAPVYDYEWEG